MISYGEELAKSGGGGELGERLEGFGRARCGVACVCAMFPPPPPFFFFEAPFVLQKETPLTNDDDDHDGDDDDYSQRHKMNSQLVSVESI